MMTNEGYTNIVNFMTPEAGIFVLGRSHMSCNEKALFLFFHLYTQAEIRQTRSMVMMTKEESTRTMNFITPGVWGMGI